MLTITQKKYLLDVRITCFITHKNLCCLDLKFHPIINVNIGIGAQYASDTSMCPQDGYMSHPSHASTMSGNNGSLKLKTKPKMREIFQKELAISLSDNL